MKSNIYQKEYWMKKGHSEEESINLVNKWKKETSCRCKEFWMKKGHSEEESIKIVSEYQRKTALKQNDTSYKKITQYENEYWIKRGITDEFKINEKIEEAKIKSNPYLSMNKEKYESMMENRKKTYYSKSTEEIKLINDKRGKTKLQLIEKHGEYKANEMVKNRGCNKKYYRRYSKMSEIFFNKLQNLIENEILEYGKNERWIKYKGNEGFYVDLLCGNNKIIEFNGDFFHANPKIYNSDDIIKIAENFKFSAYEIWDKDKIRIDKLKELNYNVHIVWENDVKNNIDDELNKCINFLKNN